MVLVRKNPERRDPATSWMWNRWSQHGQGQEWYIKEGSELDLRKQLSIPPSLHQAGSHAAQRQGEALAFGSHLLGPLGSGLEGSVWDQDFGLGLVWLTLREYSSHFPGFWGDSHKGLQGLPWSPDCRLGEVGGGRCCFTLHFSTPLPQDYITPEISLYSEEGLKGQQVKLTEALEDPQSLERPLQVASATVTTGL